MKKNDCQDVIGVLLPTGLNTSTIQHQFLNEKQEDIYKTAWSNSNKIIYYDNLLMNFLREII